MRVSKKNYDWFYFYQSGSKTITFTDGMLFCFNVSNPESSDLSQESMESIVAEKEIELDSDGSYNIFIKLTIIKTSGKSSDLFYMGLGKEDGGDDYLDSEFQEVNIPVARIYYGKPSGEYIIEKERPSNIDDYESEEVITYIQIGSVTVEGGKISQMEQNHLGAIMWASPVFLGAPENL